jgi:hypothetical protein
MNGGDASPHRPPSDFQLAFAGNQRGVPDLYALNIRDCVIRTGRAVKGNSKIASARLGLRYAYRDEKAKNENDDRRMLA